VKATWRPRTLALISAGVLTTVVLSVAAQAGRPRPVEVEPQPIDYAAVATRKADPAYVDEEPVPSPEAVTEARALGLAEAGLVMDERQSRLRPVSTDLPSVLAASIPTAPDAAAEALAGLHLVHVRDEGSFQEAGYSDGSGMLFVSWQRWPETVDPSLCVTEFATVERRGAVDLVIEDVDLPGVAVRSVRIFDGSYLVTVSGYDIDQLGIAAVRRLAEAVYQRLADSQ